MSDCKLLCVELYSSRKAQSANNTDMRMFRSPHFSPVLFTLSVPPTWQRVMTMTSMTSLHLMYAYIPSNMVEWFCTELNNSMGIGL